MNILTVNAKYNYHFKKGVIKMANLKKIKFYVLCAFIIFSSTIILSGCGKQYNITISKIAPVGYT